MQLDGWHDFYLVTGGGAAGLTGLMFVVISLGTKVIKQRGAENVNAFVTPTVAFFSTVLVISAVMTVPVLSPLGIACVLALGALAGAIYLVTLGLLKQLRKSTLGWEDFAWYYWFPLGCYLALLGAAVAFYMQSGAGETLTAAAMIGLLLVGIRNAWDLVLWMAKESE
jgi:hypothetical protein